MKLIIEDDEGRRTIVPFVGEAVNIGREEGNHVRLGEKNVSRKHGRILRKEGRFVVEDLQSFTGIRVNGEKVRGKRQIKAGDLVQISEYDIFLQYGPDDDPPEGGDGEDEVGLVTTDPGSRRSAAPPPPPSSAFGDDDDEPTITPTKPPSSEAGDGAAGAGVTPPPPPADSLDHAQASGAAASAPALSEAAPAAASASAGSSFGASLSPAPGSKGASKLVWIAAAAIVLILAVMLVRSHEAGDATGGPARAASAREAALQKAERAASAHRFRDALKLLREAQAAGAPAEELKGLARTEQEARAEEEHEQLQQAIHAGDWDKARAQLAALAGSPTWFGAKAQEQAALVKSGAVAAHLARGTALRAADPAGCLAQANLALAADPQSEDARALAAACGGPAQPGPDPTVEPVAALAAAPAAAAPGAAPAAAVAAPAAGAAGPAGAAAAAPSAPAPGPTDAEAEARRLLQQGNLKVASSDFAGGVADLQKAVALKPAGPLLGSLYRSLAQAYQRQGDQEKSVGYYRLYLPYCDNPTEKAFLKQAVDEFDSGHKPQ